MDTAVDSNSNDLVSRSLQLPFPYAYTPVDPNRNELVSKSLQLPFPYLWTRLLILIAIGCVPGVYNFHFRTHGHACWSQQQWAGFQESTNYIFVSMDTPVYSNSNGLFSKGLQLSFPYPWTRLLIPTEMSWFPRVYNFHFRFHGHACWSQQEWAGFQESTTSISVSMDTPVVSNSNELVSSSLQLSFSYPWTRLLIPTAMSWFPRVYNFHFRIHGHACWFQQQWAGFQKSTTFIFVS
jgi:hypothetical protein